MIEPRRRGRPTTEEAVALRETLLDAAFALLTERGVHGFSIELLAQVSEVTKRTIYRQYENKAALIEAVVERQAVQVLRGADLPHDELPPLSRLRAWTERLFLFSADRQMQRLSLFLKSASLTEPWAAVMLSRWIEESRRTTTVLITDAQRAGDLVGGAPDRLAELLLDLTTSMSTRRYSEAITDEAELFPEAKSVFDMRWRGFLTLASPGWMDPIPPS